MCVCVCVCVGVCVRATYMFWCARMRVHVFAWANATGHCATAHVCVCVCVSPAGSIVIVAEFNLAGADLYGCGVVCDLPFNAYGSGTNTFGFALQGGRLSCTSKRHS